MRAKAGAGAGGFAKGWGHDGEAAEEHVADDADVDYAPSVAAPNSSSTIGFHAGAAPVSPVGATSAGAI